MNGIRTLMFALFGMLALSASACATVGGGSQRVLRLHTTPDYAKATVNGGEEHGANSTIELSGMGPYKIEFKKDGYYPQTVVLDASLNLYFFGNLILGPFFPVGMLVDVLTGAIHTVDHPDVRVDLKPIVVASDGLVAPSKPEQATVTPASMSMALTAEPPPETQPKKKVIAVMPMEISKSADDAKSIGESLTDQLRVSLASRGLRVIDRGTQERAMAEIIEDEKKRSYDDCTDESCQIPLGKALAATHILRTSLSRFGRMCAMTAELIALRESVTVRANTARGDCSEEGLLDVATALIAGIE